MRQHLLKFAFPVALMSSIPAWGFGTPQDVAIVGATGVGVAVAGPTVIGGAVVAVVGGTGELLGGMLCAWFDPPDTVNYATRAAPPLLLTAFNDDPSVSAALNLAAAQFVESASAAARSAKAVQASLDRWSGAKLVGTAADVANQLQWLSEWQLQLRADTTTALGYLDQFRLLLSTEAPDTAALTVTTEIMKQIRDDEAAGNFGVVEQRLIDDWVLSPVQVGQLSTYIANISDAAIDTAGDMTVSQALAGNVRVCEECLDRATAPVPEPGQAGLLLAGLATLVGLCGRKWKGGPRSA